MTRAVGAYTVALSLSAAVGQVAGGAIVSANFFGTSWRPLFLLNVPIGAALLLVALWRMDNRGQGAARAAFDVWGAITLAFAMLLCVIPLNLGFALSWPGWAIASLVLSVVLVGTLIARERRVMAGGGMPLIDLRLFFVPGASAGLAAMALTRIVWFSLIFVMALYLQSGLHESAFQSGLALLAWLIAYGISGLLYPLFARRWEGLVAAAGCLVVAAAFAGLAAAPGTGMEFFALLGVAGFAFGMLSTALVNRLTATVSQELSANLSGLLGTMVPLTAAVGVATFGSVYLAQAGDTADGAVRTFAYLCAMFGAVFVLAAAASAMTMRTANSR